jgi:hypothetical protein
MQGLDAVALYDFHDVDLDRASGAVSRVGAALSALPRAWVGLHAGVSFYRLDDGPDATTRSGIPGDATETNVMVHLLY